MQDAAIYLPPSYDSDPDRFAALAARLERAEGELADREEQWLTLEILREDIERERPA